MFSNELRAKILKMEWSSRAVADLLTAVASEAKACNLPSSTLVIPCYEAGDLQPGDYAPEIHIVCRKVAGVGEG